MVKITKEAALEYHESGRPGKIEVKPTKAYRTQTDLSLAYSPGVAFPCLEIQENPDAAYKYTDKGNLVAVISNGTAVLGLGDIGAMSGKPVMEGKGLLFKIYGGIDVFDIEVAEKDPEKFCEAVERIAPTFGGINLEDIKAPECFYIEERLKRTLDIPVMHDDQHGTAIISAAGLKNAMEVIGKDITKVKIVVNGAGAAAISCTKLYMAIGAQKENIVMLDSKGVISTSRTDLNEQKKFFATSRTDIYTLEEAVRDADVFVGLSKGNVLSKEMVKTMAKDPVIFALANPVPEISYEDAMDARPDVLMSTGRTDYPNQINNVIGFPYIFRGALDVHATAINEEMKLAAVNAIADLAKQPVPDVVNDVYKVNNLTFGRDYFIPKPVDPRLITEVSSAVAKAAIESGVARKVITNWDEYKDSLSVLLGQETKLTQKLYSTAAAHPQRVVFAEAVHPTMLKAAVQAKAEGICYPILLGNDEYIAKLAQKLDLNIEGIEIVNLRHPSEQERRERYARILTEKRQRDGYTFQEANDHRSLYEILQHREGCQGGHRHPSRVPALRRHAHHQLAQGHLLHRRHPGEREPRYRHPRRYRQARCHRRTLLQREARHCDGLPLQLRLQHQRRCEESKACRGADAGTLPRTAHRRRDAAGIRPRRRAARRAVSVHEGEGQEGEHAGIPQPHLRPLLLQVAPDARLRR